MEGFLEDGWNVLKDCFQPNVQIYQFQTLTLDFLKKSGFTAWVVTGKNISFFLMGKEIQELTTLRRWLRVGNLTA